MNKKLSYLAIVAISLAAFFGIARSGRTAGKPAAEIKIVSDDIGGVVTSSKGPEAGVWVIAETHDLPTGFRKIVVTDDQGRYVIPELPKATYDVWVRGYGLVDSPKVKAAPGKMLNLTAVIAPDPAAAAQYYPAAYWYSLMHIPPKSDFPGTGEKGNGISERVKDQGNWVELLKTDGCEACHQLGDKATRTIPSSLGAFDNSYEAWDRRIQSAQVGSMMSAVATRAGRKRMLTEYANWTDRIKNGELPPAPPRPQGTRAQRGDHPVGLGHGQGIFPRRNFRRSPESQLQSEWTRLRSPRRQLGFRHGSRSRQEFVFADSDSLQAGHSDVRAGRTARTRRRIGAMSRWPSRTLRRTA